jgi:hypothetical protein
MVKGLSKLTDEQRQLFEKTHASHMRSMGTENQQKYAKESLKKVVWDSNENCLKVYYGDIWWHYDTRGRWF